VGELVFRDNSMRVLTHCFFNEYQSACFRKEGALQYRKGAYILVLIRNGAKLAQFFKQMPMKEKRRKNSTFLTVYFAEQELI